MRFVKTAAILLEQRRLKKEMDQKAEAEAKAADKDNVCMPSEPPTNLRVFSI